MNDSIVGAPARPKRFGHPRGLFVLFFVEFWERFSFYGMRALLVLYLVAQTTGNDNPGLGWIGPNAYAFYGWYLMFVYVMSIPGGLIADKLLGQKRAVMLGGWLLCAGHLTLAVQATWAFYLGIVLIILGVGCLKPNASTLVGRLYEDEPEKRDMGFYIYYMGINLGAFTAPLIVGYVGEKIGWHYGFGLAGIGMIVGQLIFISGRRHLRGIGDLPVRKKVVNAPQIHLLRNAPQIHLLRDIFKHRNATLGLVFTALIGIGVWIGLHTWSYGLLIIALSLAVGVLLVVYNDGTAVEKDRIKVILFSFLLVFVFFTAFDLAGSLLNVYAQQKTDRQLWGFEIPASWFQSLNSLFIILFATLVGSFWIWWGKKRRRLSTSVFKMAIGIIIQGIGFFFMSAAAVQYRTQGASSMLFLVLFYLFSTLGELCASPVSLSFTTKLAPLRWGSFFMGAYFAATGLGDKLGGLIAESTAYFTEFEVFTGIALCSILLALLVLAVVKPLKRLAHGVEDAGFAKGVGLQTEIE
ncbi:MAG: peptide MFS transporter [Flavobacteriales bacterium]